MISFAKYQSAGNDFIIFPEGESVEKEEIPSLCHRRFGIGADGVLTWQKEGRGFRFQIYNSDGSEAEMCGNGLRCVAHFIAQGYGNSLLLFSQRRNHQCTVSDRTVEVELGEPLWKEEALILEEGLPSVAVIDTGVPHAVFQGEGFEKYASLIRNHSKFQPNGVNVTCIEKEVLRTYERGVEEETYACGTGAAAALAFLARKEGISSYTATFRRGTVVMQHFIGQSIYQSAPVDHIFSGVFHTACKEESLSGKR